LKLLEPQFISLVVLLLKIRSVTPVLKIPNSPTLRHLSRVTANVPGAADATESERLREALEQKWDN